MLTIFGFVTLTIGTQNLPPRGAGNNSSKGKLMLEPDLERNRTAAIVGPRGNELSRDTLPPPNTSRWVVRRKAEVVAAVDGGLLSIAEACDRYGLTLEEFASWQRAIEREGMAGLRATRVQYYRNAHERQMRRQ